MAERLTIGLLGEPERLNAWEQYLRPHPSVGEVVLTQNVLALGKIDACIILDEHDPISYAFTLARQGVHIFIVGKLPSDLPSLKRLQFTAEESRVVMQFSNWAYFNPVTLWMMEHVARPRMIHITREIPKSQADENLVKLDNMWIEDLSLVLKWIDSGVHRLDTQEIPTEGGIIARNAYIQFDNGASASFFLSTHANEQRHQRFVYDQNVAVEADILAKKASVWHIAHPELPVEQRTFSKELAANQAINRFLKSMQMKRISEYGIYDVVRLMKIVSSSKGNESR
jgi:hypothetical protein